MPWIGAMGAAAIGAIAGTTVAAGLGAYVVGGIIVGAVVGAVYQGLTGGSILKGMLYGAIGGAAVGGAGYALVGAGAAGGASGSISVGMASGGGTAGAVGGGTTVSTAGLGLAGSGNLAIGVGGATKAAGGATGGFLASLKDASVISGIAGIGKEFLAGGLSGQDPIDKDWEREKMDRESAELAKEREAKLQMASMRSGSEGNSAALQYKAASERLALEKQKFREEFDEQKRQFDVNRDDEIGAKDRFQKSVEQGGAYAAGQAQTVSLVEINRQRKELPSPPWISGKSVNKTSPTTPQVA